MTQPIIEVLVVDDDRATAEEYARLIRIYTGLTTAFTDNPAEAIEIVRGNKVAVAALDQKMPGLRGTELYLRLKELQPRIRAILVSGQADAKELGDALNLGFNRYLDKSNIVDVLPIAVLKEYNDYRIEVLSQKLADTEPVVLAYRPKLFERPRVTYRLISVEVIDHEHIPSNGWETVVTVQAGKSEKATLKTTVEQTVVFEAESSAKLTASLGVETKHIAALSSKIQSELSERFKQTATHRYAVENTIERSYALPSEPANPKDLHVRARRVQEARVYRQVNVNLRAECECCNQRSLVMIGAFVGTGMMALRHVDRLSNGTEKIIDLGMSAG
jgi:CheY-like chemotaxis protein